MIDSIMTAIQNIWWKLTDVVGELGKDVLTKRYERDGV